MPLSPLEQVLLPYLEFQINGRWYATREEALAAGVSASSIRLAVGLAGESYYRQLEAVRSQPPAQSRKLSFKLDLNKYLQLAGKLRIVRVQTI
jgi:hypothetical protein